MSRARWIVTAISLLLAYACFLFVIRGWQLGLIDSAIGDLRVFASAQLAYAKLNGGFNEADLACLDRPNTCIPSQQHAFAGKSMISLQNIGDPLSVRWKRERRAFAAGPPASPRVVAQQALSPTSAQGFRAVANASLGRWWTSRLLKKA